MSTITEGLKRLAYVILPGRVLTALKEIHYARSLRHMDESEETDLGALKYLVPEGGLAVDIGANIGLYTKIMSVLVGKGGRVLSIEPVPETFRYLGSNVRKLGLRNVTTVNQGLSDHAGRSRMEVPQFAWGGRNFYEAHITTGSSEATEADGFDIELTTLDSLTEKIERPISFIKCDVEGHELHCLRGARQTIEQHRPAWLIEINGDPDEPESRAHSVFALMASFGYRPFVFDGRSFAARGAGERRVNYFFFTDEHTDRLSEHICN